MYIRSYNTFPCDHCSFVMLHYSVLVSDRASLPDSVESKTPPPSLLDGCSDEQLLLMKDNKGLQGGENTALHYLWCIRTWCLHTCMGIDTLGQTCMY